MFQKFKKIDYRYYLATGLLLSSVVLCLFVYRYPLLRLWESIEAFGRAFAYAFLNSWGIAEKFPITQTVNNYSTVDLAQAIDFDIYELADKLTRVWDEIFVAINIQYYGLFLLWHLTKALYNSCIAL